MVDFGAEDSFAAAAARMQEHHGLRVSAWRVRQQTYHHAKAMGDLEPPKRQPSAVLVTQIDGSMIPILEPAQGSGDKRRWRRVSWRETRACLARDQNSATPIYGASLGSAEVAGMLWREVALWAGLDEHTFVHAIADGAPWIFPQARTQFGEKLTCLVDFYHVSEYLAAAAPRKDPKAWLRRQQDHLLENRAGQILRNLSPRQEGPEAEDRPVAQAYRYIAERRAHLDYAGARAQNLPIGSGEIESAHRHLIQPRLKIPGAWKETHAHLMLSLRTARANGLWEKSWNPQLN
jgi:hypothetical protein